MAPHVTILRQVYAELINDSSFPKVTESFGERPLFCKDVFRSPTIMNGFWASIEFGIHQPEAKYTHSASLKLFERTGSDGDSVTYLELQAFDLPGRYHLSGINVFLGQGKDQTKVDQCRRIISRVQNLKRNSVRRRLLELIHDHYAPPPLASPV